MRQLTKPTDELVNRVLGDVEYDGRLVGYRIHKRYGPTEIVMYRFAEVVAFLREQHVLIDFDELVCWTKEVIRDSELEEAIKHVIASESDVKTRISLIQSILADRLNQCENIV